MNKLPISPVSAELVRSLLEYNPETGIFIWKDKVGADQNRWNTRYARKQAGGINGSGYIVIRINDNLLRAHRLAWLYMTGKWPAHEIDHKDGDRMNNKFNNLREATRAQNRRNTKIRIDNTSGYKGVSYHKQHKLWMAYIAVDKKRKCLGWFKTKEAAHAAYCAAAPEIHGEFARIA